MDVLYKRDGYGEYKCCRYKREDDMWCCVCIRAMNCTYKRRVYKREDCTYKRRRCKGTGKKEEMGVYKRIKIKQFGPLRAMLVLLQMGCLELI